MKKEPVLELVQRVMKNSSEVENLPVGITLATAFGKPPGVLESV